MPITITGSLSSPRAFGEAVERDGRRAIANALRQQGIAAGMRAQQLAETELGPSRVGNRRRDKGVSYRNGWDPVLYTGLEDFAAGEMQITLRNRSRHARVLEVGAKAHRIPVGEKGVLAWPVPYHLPGRTKVRLKRAVRHKGFTGKRILQRAVVETMQNGFVGRTLGHAVVQITTGGRR